MNQSMTRVFYIKLSLALILFLNGAFSSIGQTTISTLTTAATTTTSPGVVTFAVRNTNSYPIAVTEVSGFHNTVNNNRFYTVWYHPSTLTGIPSVTAANGWLQFGVSPTITATASGILPLVTNKYLVIPGNTTYRFAITVNTGSMYYGTSATTTWSQAGVDVLTGTNVVSPGYAGAFPTPTTTPATFAGAVKFQTASVNNLSALLVVQPIANAQFCSYTSSLVRAVVRNLGSNPQTNFPVTAAYTSTNGTSTITGNYTGTLQPFTSDTVVIGTILPPAGTYTMRAYTQLATDTVFINDTTNVAVSFTYKPVVPIPTTFSDTQCLGNTAFIGVSPVSPNTSYKWYSAATNGTLLNISNILTFPNLSTDTVMYISALFNGCESDRAIVSAIVGNPPVVNIGNDTSFCNSIPLTISAGNPFSKYLWSTGDTTQTITLNGTPGTYWVKVTKYCSSTDTINTTIAPMPTATGISFVRMANTYFFTPSNVQHVKTYLWIFGDGTTSTDSASLHTYAYGQIHPDYMVKLVIGNVCGTDTIQRKIPTYINELNLQDFVKVFPNPTNDVINIDASVAKIQEILVLNHVGALLIKKEISPKTKAEISLNELPAGNYFITIKTSEGKVTKAIQVLR